MTINEALSNYSIFNLCEIGRIIGLENSIMYSKSEFIKRIITDLSDNESAIQLLSANIYLSYDRMGELKACLNKDQTNDNLVDYVIKIKDCLKTNDNYEIIIAVTNALKNLK